MIQISETGENKLFLALFLPGIGHSVMSFFFPLSFQTFLCGHTVCCFSGVIKIAEMDL